MFRLFGQASVSQSESQDYDVENPPKKEWRRLTTNAEKELLQYIHGDAITFGRKIMVGREENPTLQNTALVLSPYQMDEIKRVLAYLKEQKKWWVRRAIEAVIFGGGTVGVTWLGRFAYLSYLRHLRSIIQRQIDPLLLIAADVFDVWNNQSLPNQSEACDQAATLPSNHELDRYQCYSLERDGQGDSNKIPNFCWSLVQKFCETFNEIHQLELEQIRTNLYHWSDESSEIALKITYIVVVALIVGGIGYTNEFENTTLEMLKVDQKFNIDIPANLWAKIHSYSLNKTINYLDNTIKEHALIFERRKKNRELGVFISLCAKLEMQPRQQQSQDLKKQFFDLMALPLELRLKIFKMAQVYDDGIEIFVREEAWKEAKRMALLAPNSFDSENERDNNEATVRLRR